MCMFSLRALRQRTSTTVKHVLPSSNGNAFDAKVSPGDELGSTRNTRKRAIIAYSHTHETEVRAVPETPRASVGEKRPSASERAGRRVSR